jgi:hypothetical protein
MADLFSTKNVKMEPLRYPMRKILIVGGTVWIILALSFGFLWTAQASSSTANSLFQVGVLDCPTGLAIDFIPSNPKPGESIEFTGTVITGSGVLIFTWNFDDGSGLFSGQKIKHTYTHSGVYMVRLTVTEDSCADPPSLTKPITVGTFIHIPNILK